MTALTPNTDPELRDLFFGGMSRLPGGVCLITAKGADGSLAGLTVSSAVSLSADPPSMLVCVNKATRSHSIIVGSGAFAANVIGSADRELAMDFAGKKTAEEKFARGDWMQLSTGSPILATAAVAFDCRLREVLDATTHSILIGDVAAVHTPDAVHMGLAYWNRKFVTLAIEDLDR